MKRQERVRPLVLPSPRGLYWMPATLFVWPLKVSVISWG